MRILLFLAALLIIMACQEKTVSQPITNNTDANTIEKQTLSAEESTIKKQLNVELDKAKAANDFRLYAAKGRRIIIPGLVETQFSKAKKYCGIQYIAGMGDVIRKAEDKEKYRIKYMYASEYNKAMYVYCMNNR